MIILLKRGAIDVRYVQYAFIKASAILQQMSLILEKTKSLKGSAKSHEKSLIMYSGRRKMNIKVTVYVIWQGGAVQQCTAGCFLCG